MSAVYPAKLKIQAYSADQGALSTCLAGFEILLTAELILGIDPSIGFGALVSDAARIEQIKTRRIGDRRPIESRPCQKKSRTVHCPAVISK